MDGCPAEETIVDLLSGRLDAGAKQALYEHVDACDDCRTLIAAATLDLSADASAAGPSDRVPPLLRRGAEVGRYRVLEIVGAGAMGVIYAAEDPELGRRVALKLLRADGQVAGPGDERRVRLVREAQALARLAHPNVITVHDVGTHGEQVFLAMELVEGETLRAWLARASPSRSAVLAAFRQAGEGLAAAHAVGLVHRDFKPDNVLVGRDGRVRVTDFGLARAAGAVPEAAPGAAGPRALVETITRAGALVGTPAYMAPEQLAGAPADARSDQFAFAVALYEALHGERPFAGDDLADLEREVRASAVRPPPRGARVPRRLRRALLRGLRASPEDRWPSMEALLGALDDRPSRGRRLALGAAVLALAVVPAVALLARGGMERRNEVSPLASGSPRASIDASGPGASAAPSRPEGDWKYLPPLPSTPIETSHPGSPVDAQKRPPPPRLPIETSPPARQAKGTPRGDRAPGTGGTGSCVATPGMCGAPFTVPAAGPPAAGCTDPRELAFIPDGTVLKKSCSPYHVKGGATASGHLTIEAGVHVQLADDAHFDVGDANSLPGSVDANGTACDPIVFEPDSASGHFGHVKIGSAFPGEGKGNSHLHYVEFNGGASKPATLDPSDFVLFLTGKAPVLLDHVDILDSKHFGLGLAQGQPLAPASNHVFIDGTPDGSVFLGNSDSLDGFPTILVGCNPGPGILIESALVARSMRWAAQPVPLLFRSGTLAVRAQENPTVLTIAAPNTLLFGATVSVRVGGNVGVPANLVADGAITFDAIDPVSGWRGFLISGSANQGTVLRGGHVGHAGTVQPFGTWDGKQAYASIIINQPDAPSAAGFPTIERETIHDANPAPPGANHESACIYVTPRTPGTEPDYSDAMHANTFRGCDAGVARSDKP